MCRFGLTGLAAFSLCGVVSCLVADATASSFGYSLNINFAADQQPVRDEAGVFRDRYWNNFNQPVEDRPMQVVADLFGNRSPSTAQLTWNSKSVDFVDSVKPTNPEDGLLMRGFLSSPSKIVLEGVDQVVPPQRGPITYSVILYAFGGREGEKGTYTVNGQTSEHVDSAVFDGTFRKGVDGNILVFKDLVGPNLVIETDDFGPLNAMSLIYCRPGDFDGDGSLDVNDLKMLNESFKSGSNELSYDVNFDLTVDFKDVLSWIKCSKGTCIGDVNLDGIFDSSDLIQLFQQVAYESGELALWTQGDWNGDCKFDSGDLLVAFQAGCYQSESLFATACGGPVDDGAETSFVSIPEPTATCLLAWGAFWLIPRLRRRRRGA